MTVTTIAGVQQQMRLFETVEAYQKELSRFLYMARAKGAKLVVLPALSGVIAATPLVEGRGIQMLRRAENHGRSSQSFWNRTRSAVAGRTANLLKADFRKAFGEVLRSDPTGVLRAYNTLFSGLAQSYGLAILAGSAYLPDAGGTIRHRTTVFGPNGALLGSHDAVVLSREDAALAQPGSAWEVIDTPAGGVGILLGQEALYPEAGRVLAQRGALLLVTLSATPDEAEAAYLRQATIARSQENQVFGMTSFLVGRNYLSPAEAGEVIFAGRSGIYAPLEMTPRYSGIMVEMGTATSEGLLTAELDRDALRSLWGTGIAATRRQVPAALLARDLAALGAGEPGAEITGRPAELPAVSALSVPEETPPAEPASDVQVAAAEQAQPGDMSEEQEMPPAQPAEPSQGAHGAWAVPDEPSAVNTEPEGMGPEEPAGEGGEPGTSGDS